MTLCANRRRTQHEGSVLRLRPNWRVAAKPEAFSAVRLCQLLWRLLDRPQCTAVGHFVRSGTQRSCSIEPAQIARSLECAFPAATSKRGPHRAAEVTGALECPVERQPRVKIVGATRNEFLRAEEMGSAPADGISISVKRHRATRPVTTWARDRSRNRIARVCHVAGLRGVSRAVGIGYCTADDGAGHHASGDADTDSAAP